MSKSDSLDPVKETCRLIRLARSYWDAHRNHACRTHRDMAMKLYESLSKEQKEEIPQVLRVWLRYRSEKYFGPGRTAPGTGRKKKKRQFVTKVTRDAHQKALYVKPFTALDLKYSIIGLLLVLVLTGGIFGASWLLHWAFRPFTLTLAIPRFFPQHPFGK